MDKTGRTGVGAKRWWLCGLLALALGSSCAGGMDPTPGGSSLPAAPRDLEAEAASLRGEAIQRLETFVAREPAHPKHTPDALLRLASLHTDAAQALESTLTDLDPDPEATEAILGHLHQANASLRRILEEFPQAHQSEARYLLGFNLEKERRFEEALQVWEKLQDSQPTETMALEVWLRQGEIHFEEGRIEEAIRAWARASARPGSPWRGAALYKLGWALYRSDRYPEAIQIFVALLSYLETPKVHANDPGRSLRPEAIEYLAILLAEEDRDGDGQPDGLPPLEQRLGAVLKGESRFSKEVCEATARFVERQGRAREAAGLCKGWAGPAGPDRQD